MENLDICGAKNGDIVCTLAPGHELGKEDGKHFAIVGDALTEFEAEKQPADISDVYWCGYWWPDVEKCRLSAVGSYALWREQEWRPGEDPGFLEYRGLVANGNQTKEWHLGWHAEIALRDGLRCTPLRKETEDDYVWRGYTLKEIKEANEKYRQRMGGDRYGSEIWYLEKGEIWSKYGEEPKQPPHRPWGGGQKFIDTAVDLGYLPEKDPK